MATKTRVSELSAASPSFIAISPSHVSPHDAAESPSQSDIPDDLPPPYTPPASGQGSGSPTTIPPPPSTSSGAPKRPPRCTCPRAGDADHPGDAAATDSDPPSEGTAGTDWGKKLKGAALVAIAAPTLAVAGATIALPVLGFASTGVVGGLIAAAVQSAVYGGATGGLFSVMQSVGAPIVAPSLMSTVTAGGAATLGLNMIAGGDQRPEEGEGDDGDDDDGEDGAQVPCSCVACVCDTDCECACRRQQRGE
uniref:Potassium/sodium efflux P-type ATPase n=1 Tax=Ganoderma boninense TaxID=34458 RepID=A0A5K1JZD2_9APHY|nr:Potassium/sodium efflux P-type ATPase [Ganoderma boninense]